MEVLAAIAARRMHRSFDGSPVDPAVVERLVDAAARAPMAANVGVRRIVVVTDPAILRTLRQVTPGLTADPPVLLALCTDLAQAELQTGAHGRDISSWIDAGAAAENVALAALELGLGVCFARSCNDAALRIVLALPPEVRPDILVGVGHPTARGSATSRRPATPVYRDQYGTPWEVG
ncbi:MAG: nitroreductase family protein [Mycolicibacterium hassiacum]|uniref:nitroreductase family protein n=1 Tax=Mycolicibacterium hassiacum TaxID=46351 RepID=UPI0023F8116E|nr:nitroreductase family protein [Mycolicibacterium hassiacum]MBX5485437.1 nitroreductase family protein [Mycolicibacterium hassiacum]